MVKRKAPPPAKPGLTYQHLIEVYSSLPDDGTLKIGHVLHIFCGNAKSVAKTVQAVKSLLAPSVTTDANQIRTMGNKYEAFKNPSQPSEWRRYVGFCDAKF